MGLDDVEMIMEIEEQFGISIPDEDAAQLRTVGAVISYVTLRVHGSLPMTPWMTDSEIARRVRLIMAEQLAISPDQVRDDVTLHDLGF